MNKTALKKSILFVLALVLFVTFIVQTCVSRQTKIFEVAIKKDIDCVTIDSSNGGLRLEKIDGNWKVSYADSVEKKFDTDEFAVENILTYISKLRFLGTVSGGNENRLQRYGLDKESKITVKAYGKNILLRTLDVGKNSTSGVHSYTNLDEKKSVHIADSPLRSIFEKTLPSLRNKTLYAVSSDSISSASVKKAGVEYEVLRTSAQTKELTDTSIDASQMSEWILIKIPEEYGEMVLDQGSVGTWIDSLKTATVTSWCENDVVLPEGEPQIEINFAVGGMMYSMQMFENDDKYLCSINQTSGLFYLSKSTAENIAKDLGDLLVKSDSEQTSNNEGSL